MASFNETPTLESIRMMLGMRLRALRQEKKLTQKVAAERLELPARTLSSYERGDAFPSLNRAHTICKFYDAPMDFLFDGKGLNRTLNTKLGTMAQRR